MNVLAIGAHPDDVEIFCGGTLAKCKERGDNIFIIITTNGNMGSNVLSREEIAKVREEEQIAAAKILGAEVKFLRYDDEELMDTPEVRRTFIEAIRWANPDLIFTSSPNDKNPDHIMTGQIVRNVLPSLRANNALVDAKPLEKRPAVFFWETLAGIDFLPEVYVDITDTMETKRKALLAHKSQNAWTVVNVDDTIEIMSRFRGLQNSCKYAEAFIPHRICGYMPDFKLLP